MKLHRIIFSSFVFILLSFCAIGQTDRERADELRQLYWGNVTQEWKETQVPEKWKNESAVILAKKTNYWVKKIPVFNTLEEYFHVHKRVKIQDDNALKKYSKFTFANDENRNYRSIFGTNMFFSYYGIKIVKEDGSEQIIDDSTKVEQEILHGMKQLSESKIAIPNLEKGDIIDFYYCMEHRFSIQMFHVFEPVNYFMNDVYPIVHQELSVEMARKCYLNCKSINSAPQMIEKQQAEKSNVYSYHMIDKDREKVEDQNWIYPYAELPRIKFQAFNPGPPLTFKPPYHVFWGKKSKIKDHANIAALSEVWKSMRLVMRCPFYSKLNKYIKSRHKKNVPVDVERLVNDAYYFLREFWIQQQFFMIKQTDGYWQYPNMESTCLILSKLLDSYNIAYQILYTMPKHLGKPDDVLFLQELNVGLLIENGKNPIYLTHLETNSFLEDIPEVLQGVNAFAVAPADYIIMERIRIPVLEQKDQTHIFSKISINSKAQKVEVESRFEMEGFSKLSLDSIVITPSVLYNEFKRGEYGKYIKDKGKKIEELRNFSEKLSIYFKESDQERRRSFKNYIKSYFDLKHCKLIDFKLLSSGRWKDKSTMTIVVKWESEDLQSTFDSKLLLNIGKLYRAPVNRELLVKNRKMDIHFNSDRNMSHEITLLVPENFEVKGIDVLQSNYSNELFKLNSDYQMKEKEIKIKYEQFSKQKHITKDKWKLVKEFFEQINLQTQNQLLLQER